MVLVLVSLSSRSSSVALAWSASSSTGSVKLVVSGEGPGLVTCGTISGLIAVLGGAGAIYSAMVGEVEYKVLDLFLLSLLV